MRRQVVGCLTCGATEHITEESPYLKGTSNFPMFEQGMIEHAICPVCEAETLWATKDIDNFTPSHMALFDQERRGPDLPENTKGITRLDDWIAPGMAYRHVSIPGEFPLDINVLHQHPKPIRLLIMLS